MDKSIRRNQICVIGLPRCDFVFSSTRTCFIAYGFRTSTLEMNVLRNLLERRGIQPVEAGGMLAPGQNAFCAKICSKIITSQFCVVLVNNDLSDGREIPNTNVNMEYGLMIGFNKYVIPFQRASQSLPFNVAGLDTIKYSDMDFERLAGGAIDQAILETQQETPAEVPIDQLLSTFLLRKGKLVSDVNAPSGDKVIFQMGQPVGFNLINDFSALKYTYFGNFTALRPEIVVWRIKTLAQILYERQNSIDIRVKLGLVSEGQRLAVNTLFGELQIWVLVTSNEDKKAVLDACSIRYPLELFSLDDVRSEVEKV
jgi:hypothetical protein